MAQVLKLVDIKDRFVVGQITLADDGTVHTEGPAVDGIVASLLREEVDTEQEAFDWLAENGWTNGNLMIDRSPGE